MRDGLLIYGATGYTGGLIAREAVGRGLCPALGGRHPGRLARLAHELGGLRTRVAELGDRGALAEALRDVAVVLNAAGPFSVTAQPLVEACLAAGVHYLDVTGEVDVLAALEARDGEARARGVMLLPGVGFDVVPSDCLAAHVAARAPGATWLALGVRGLVFVSRGSYRTLVTQAGRGVRVRRAGRLVRSAPGALRRSFDFGDADGALRPALAVSWGDLVSAWHTTGIPDVEVYFESTPGVTALLGVERAFGGLLRSRTLRALVGAHAELLPEGPGEEARLAREAVLVAEAGDARGPVAAARLTTPEAYTFTGRLASEIAARVLEGRRAPGFQTPAGLFGPDFVLRFAGVTRVDLPTAAGVRAPDQAARVV